MSYFRIPTYCGRASRPEHVAMAASLPRGIFRQSALEVLRYIYPDSISGFARSAFVQAFLAIGPQHGVVLCFRPA